MQNQYSVHIDRRGYVLIPAEVRKAMGIEPKSFLILSQQGDEIRLVKGEVIPKRGLRVIPREELAQGLIDMAITPEEVADAEKSIRQLGLDPTQFVSKF